MLYYFFPVVNIEEIEARNEIEEEGQEAKIVVPDTVREKDQEVETGNCTKFCFFPIVSSFLFFPHVF